MVWVALAGVAAMLAGGGVVRAEPGLIVGVDEDMMKWSSDPESTLAIARDLGLGAIRVTLHWAPGRVRLSHASRVAVWRAVRASQGLRLVLAVYGKAAQAPQTPEERNHFCYFVRNVLTTFATIGDVVIWNEPNNPVFWRPQFAADGTSAAGPAYEALLARCYDVLHAARPGVNVIAASAPRGNDDPTSARPSESPVAFYRALADAYRASGRQQPLFDTVGHNAYPDNPGEPPRTTHGDPGTVSEGDLEKLIAAVNTAFAGTAQPVFGSGLRVWYMEDGFQTRAAAPSSRQASAANTSGALTQIEQARQLADAVKLAYCQPYVAAFFNFLLTDEQRPDGWRSGVLSADGHQKAAFAALRATIRQIQAGTVYCSPYNTATNSG
jgi:hypothetical protein